MTVFTCSQKSANLDDFIAGQQVVNIIECGHLSWGVTVPNSTVASIANLEFGIFWVDFLAREWSECCASCLYSGLFCGAASGGASSCGASGSGSWTWNWNSWEFWNQSLGLIWCQHKQITVVWVSATGAQAGQPWNTAEHIIAEEVLLYTFRCQTGHVDNKDDSGLVGFVVRLDLNVRVQIGWHASVRVEFVWSIRDTGVQVQNVSVGE